MEDMTNKRMLENEELAKNPRVLAIFDLDDTLVDGQSQMHLIFYLQKKNLIGLKDFLVVLAWFVAYKFHFAKDPKQIMEYAFRLVRGKSESEVDEILRSFFSDVLKNKYKKEIVEKVKEHKAKGDFLVLLSNCISPLVKIVADDLGFDKFIATQLMIKDGKYTGAMEDLVYGEKKVESLEKVFSKEDIENAVSYADHYSDSFFMQKTRKAFLVDPSEKTLKFFEENYKKENLEILK